MLQVTLFGTLTLQNASAHLDAESSRRHKLWRALAYLLHRRTEGVTVDEFARFLTEDDPERIGTPSADSLVKTTLYRLRLLLAPLGESDAACRLLCRDARIRFDPALCIVTDTDRFATLERALFTEQGDPYALDDPEHIVSLYTELCTLYRGPYLAAFSNESLFAKEAKQYRQRFLALSERVLPLLFAQKRYATIQTLMQHACEVDPYSECFHHYRIRATAALGDTETALSLFDSVLRLYYNHFHINPSLSFRRLRDELLQERALPESPTDAAALLWKEGQKYLRNETTPSEFVRAFSLVRSVCREKRVLFALLPLAKTEEDESAFSEAFDRLLQQNPTVSGFFCRYWSELAVLLLYGEEPFEKEAWEKALASLPRACVNPPALLLF